MGRMDRRSSIGALDAAWTQFTTLLSALDSATTGTMVNAISGSSRTSKPRPPTSGSRI